MLHMTPLGWILKDLPHRHWSNEEGPGHNLVRDIPFTRLDTDLIARSHVQSTSCRHGVWDNVERLDTIAGCSLVIRTLVCCIESCHLLRTKGMQLRAPFASSVEPLYKGQVGGYRVHYTISCTM